MLIKSDIYKNNVDLKKISMASYIKSARSHLLKRQRTNFIVWYVIAIFIGMINIAIISITITILVIFFNFYFKYHDGSFFGIVAGSLALVLLTLSSFFFFFFISIYKVKNKREIYKKSYKEIQFETIKYINTIETKSSAYKYKRKINLIIKKALEKNRNKLSIKNSLIPTFLGGIDV